MFLERLLKKSLSSNISSMCFVSSSHSIICSIPTKDSTINISNKFLDNGFFILFFNRWMINVFLIAFTFHFFLLFFVGFFAIFFVGFFEIFFVGFFEIFFFELFFVIFFPDLPFFSDFFTAPFCLSGNIITN